MGGRTLDQLDPPAWVDPPTRSSLVDRCYALRSKPIDEFTPEDLRIMIGQKICLDWLVPIALDLLEEDPFVAGDFYDGDLLVAVLRARSELTTTNPKLLRRVEQLATPALADSTADKLVKKAIADFNA